MADIEQFISIIFQWQTLIAGLIAFLGGSFAILAVSISNSHQRKEAKKNQKELENKFYTYYCFEVEMTKSTIIIFLDWLEQLSQKKKSASIYPPSSNLVLGEGLVNLYASFDKGRKDNFIAITRFTHNAFRAQIAIRDVIAEIDDKGKKFNCEKVNNAIAVCRQTLESSKELMLEIKENDVKNESTDFTLPDSAILYEIASMISSKQIKEISAEKHRNFSVLREILLTEKNTADFIKCELNYVGIQKKVLKDCIKTPKDLIYLRSLNLIIKGRKAAVSGWSKSFSTFSTFYSIGISLFILTSEWLQTEKPIAVIIVILVLTMVVLGLKFSLDQRETVYERLAILLDEVFNETKH